MAGAHPGIDTLRCLPPDTQRSGTRSEGQSIGYCSTSSTAPRLGSLHGSPVDVVHRHLYGLSSDASVLHAPCAPPVTSAEEPIYLAGCRQGDARKKFPITLHDTCDWDRYVPVSLWGLVPEPSSLGRMVDSRASAVHVAGADHVMADALSRPYQLVVRDCMKTVEWEFDQRVADHLFQMREPPWWTFLLLARAIARS